MKDYILLYTYHLANNIQNENEQLDVPYFVTSLFNCHGDRTKMKDQFKKKHE